MAIRLPVNGDQLVTKHQAVPQMKRVHNEGVSAFYINDPAVPWPFAMLDGALTTSVPTPGSVAVISVGALCSAVVAGALLAADWMVPAADDGQAARSLPSA